MTLPQRALSPSQHTLVHTDLHRFTSFSVQLPLPTLVSPLAGATVFPTSPRHPWPPPRSVLDSWCALRTKARSRERSSTRVSRGRRPPSSSCAISTWVVHKARIIAGWRLSPHDVRSMAKMVSSLCANGEPPLPRKLTMMMPTF